MNEKKSHIPKFQIPATFASGYDYLRHLTYNGAERNYKVITEEICKRIDEELEAIRIKGFVDCFLVLQEIMQAVRGMNILMSARATSSGSVVNYCLGITDIDPVKYGLRYESFLKLDKTTLPYFAFDLEEGGQGEIELWIKEKYGKERVARMATFSKNKDRMGVHPFAIVIGAENLENIFSLVEINGQKLIPHERSYIKEKGLVILDFLELRTLSAIKEMASNIKKTQEIEIDISKIPLDDAKTFQLFGKGGTKNVFWVTHLQEEMQTYLHQSPPCKFEDLIALITLFYESDIVKPHYVTNALLTYRMAYLKANFPNEFINH